MSQQFSNPMIGEISSLFSVLGDASRLKILLSLLGAEGPVSQGTVAGLSGISLPNASKHLAHLVRVGLVRRSPEGTAVYYTPVKPIVAVLLDLVHGHVSEHAKMTYKALR
jgi:DNA-binding transcriptional ArsR family regulator